MRNDTYWPRIRNLVLISAAVAYLLVAVRVLTYRAILAEPGGKTFVVESALALLLPAGLALLAGWGGNASRQSALAAATPFGVGGGLLLALHVGLENFAGHVGENKWVTLAFMGAAFLLWAAAGFRAARRAPAPLAVLAGCWSGEVSVLLTVLFGFLLTFANIPSAAYVATWSEFRQSGWNDAHAFSIANSLEAGMTHLVAGLVLGVICGFIGLLTAAMMDHVRKSGHQSG